MTRSPTPWLILTLAAALALALTACSGGGRAGAGPSDQVRSKLLKRQQVKLHQRLFYVGIADGATLEEATQTAYGEITRQLTWLPDGSRHLLHGMYRVDRNVPDDDGRIHVLAVLEREAASAHLNKLSKEQRANLSTSLSGCEALVKDGDLPRAKSCYTQRVAPGVERVRVLLAAARAAVGDLARPAPFPELARADALKRQIGASEVRGRSVMVGVVSVVDGKQQGDLNAEFSRSVASAGLKLAAGGILPLTVKLAVEGNTSDAAKVAKDAGAGYAVVGLVEAKFSSEESGQFFAWASGRVRVIETTSSKVVADLSYDKIKGGHISRQQACDRALSNAVIKLKADLRLKLVALTR
jgi:hypothetical protein